eukprot:6618718-Pyramimonas_sp.AAC.1
MSQTTSSAECGRPWEGGQPPRRLIARLAGPEAKGGGHPPGPRGERRGEAPPHSSAWPRIRGLGAKVISRVILGGRS